MLRRVVLHGHLREVYAGELEFDVESVAETLRACCTQLDGFTEALREGAYRVAIQNDNPDNDIGTDAFNFNLGSADVIHFIPVIAGAKGGGGKVILGVAMIGLAIATSGASFGALGGIGITGGGSLVGSAGFAAATGGFGIGAATIGKLGLALVLGGASSLLSPKVKNDKAEQYERPDQRPSFLFNGPVNATEQGGPVPLVYGRCRVGSYVVSAGLATENI